MGSEHSDVKVLQQVLNNLGYTVSSTGAGSKGNETTYFGERTRSALARYQSAHGITPAAGYFGPKTRAYMNSHETTTTQTTGSGDGFTLESLVKLFIALGIIPAEKAEKAMMAVRGLE